MATSAARMTEEEKGVGTRDSERERFTDARYWRIPGNLRRARGSVAATPLGIVTAAIIVSALMLSLSSVHAGAGGAQMASRGSPLHPPADLAAVGVDQGIALTWQPAQPRPVGYRIYRTVGRHGLYTIIGTVDAPDVGSFVDTGDIMPGMTYAYTVTSYDRTGESVPGGPIVAIVIAPKSTPTIAAPTPLPTFAALAPQTMTAVARMPRSVGTPVSAASPALGAGTMPVPTVQPQAVSPTAATPR